MERRAEKRGVEGKLAFLLRSSNQRRIVGLLGHRTERIAHSTAAAATTRKPALVILLPRPLSSL